MPRIAIITPYCKEPVNILLQCHQSVLQQTVACTHILIADGHPRELFGESQNTMHITLPTANADYGNTPRALGGIVADTSGFDAVAFLDADNWYEPEHLDKLLLEHNRTGNPLVSCKRKFYDVAGTQLVVEEAAENDNSHVDTSCWLVFRPAFSLLRAWLMPKQLGAVADRVFLRKAQHDRFQITMTDHRTVAFRSQYAGHYAAAGAAIPDNAKTGGVGSDFHTALVWLTSLDGVIETTNALGFYPRIL